ncbi:hypothetical protein GQX74_013122 [Glossina fuscipes]|nr:hypothetical protein GQX74_013122 [Glossina fuscipes]
MKTDEIRKSVCHTEWEVVAFSKTWWNSHISSNSVNIPAHNNLNSNLINPAQSALIFNFCHLLKTAVVHNSLPTYRNVRCGSTSHFDNFLIANMELPASGQCQLANIFHHALIYVTFNSCLGKADISSEFYDYNRVNTRALRSLIGSYDFNGVYNTLDVDDQMNILIACKAYLRDKNDGKWSSYCIQTNIAKYINPIADIRHVNFLLMMKTGGDGVTTVFVDNGVAVIVVTDFFILLAFAVSVLALVLVAVVVVADMRGMFKNAGFAELCQSYCLFLTYTFHREDIDKKIETLQLYYLFCLKNETRLLMLINQEFKYRNIYVGNPRLIQGDPRIIRGIEIV